MPISQRGYIAGFHGCDKETLDKVVEENEPFNPSETGGDWLGPGIYFWEHNYGRALEWAKNSREIKTPSVIGAVIDLGVCLDLANYEDLLIVQKIYEILKEEYEEAGIPLPVNKGPKHGLDYAVLEYAVELLKDNDGLIVNTIRAPFKSGDPVYPTSKLFTYDHVQVNVLTPETSIKATFNAKTHSSIILGVRFHVEKVLIHEEDPDKMH